MTPRSTSRGGGAGTDIVRLTQRSFSPVVSSRNLPFGLRCRVAPGDGVLAGEASNGVRLNFRQSDQSAQLPLRPPTNSRSALTAIQLNVCGDQKPATTSGGRLEHRGVALNFATLMAPNHPAENTLAFTRSLTEPFSKSPPVTPVTPGGVKIGARCDAIGRHAPFRRIACQVRASIMATEAVRPRRWRLGLRARERV